MHCDIREGHIIHFASCPLGHVTQVVTSNCFAPSLSLSLVSSLLALHQLTFCEWSQIFSVQHVCDLEIYFKAPHMTLDT